MDGEINNLILMLSYIFMSSCYCYATTKLVPKGTFRFFTFLPILYIFLHLPLLFSTINFSDLTAFFVTWLASFKLLLLAFGTGPLSSPSLSLIQFYLILFLPISLQMGPGPGPGPGPNTYEKESPKKNGHHRPNSKISLKSLSYYVKCLIFLVSLVQFGGKHKDKFHPSVVLFLMFFYIYIGLEMVLGLLAVVGQKLLGTKIDPPFNDPYLATSLQDFWGRRWNRVASASLRSTIFYPTFNYTSRLLGRKWATFLALVVTFIVSDVMHEVVFYYMGRVRFGWGTPLFFLLHGLLVAIESILKRKIGVKWRLPQIVSGPLIFGFVVWTFMWLVVPELQAHNVDDRILEEYKAFDAFLLDLGRALVQNGYNLTLHILRPN